jgi:hypothetical protein
MLFSTLLGFSITASVLGTAVDLRDLHEDSRSRFTRAHSLGDNYVFNSRDGWTSLNVTDMQYKYSPVSTGRQNLNDNSLDRRSSHKNKSDSKKKKTIKAKVPPKGKALFSTNSFLGDAVKDPLHSLGSAFHAIGDAVEAVIITWSVLFPTTRPLFLMLLRRYTGHDLENPSCWSDSVWTPTVSHHCRYRQTVVHSDASSLGCILRCRLDT